MPRRSVGHIARSTSPSASRRPTTRESALWLRWTDPDRSCIRHSFASASDSRSSTSSIQLGGAIGLAIVTAVVTSTTDKAASPAAVLDGFKPGLAVAAGIAVAGFGLALSGLRWRREAAVAEG
jgi:hypothetical protein